MAALIVDGKVRSDVLDAGCGHAERSAAPGADYYILVLAKGAFPAELEQKPNEVDEDELRAAVGRYWEIDEVRPAFIHANMPSGPNAPFQLPPHDHDDKGTMKMRAFLLTAHKAS